MKYTLLLLCIIAFSANGSGLYGSSSNWNPGIPYGGFDRYQTAPADTYNGTQTRRNVFGGRDIRRPGYSPITTRPNVFGGEDFYGGDRY